MTHAMAHLTSHRPSAAKARLFSVLLSALALCVPAQYSAAQEVQSASNAVGQPYPVVVELFTSQGCSSCPPADALLAELAQRDDVLALALHVDYWDYIGWKDIFADPRFTQRQRGYANAAGHRTIYTPQMIVSGQDHVVGFKPMKLANHIANHKRKFEAAQMGLTAVRSGGKLSISLENAGGPAMTMSVQVVGFHPHETVDIRVGENAGKSIDYANIVTSWTHVADWDGTVPLHMAFDAPSADPMAVIVQQNLQGLPGEIMAAVRVN